MKPHDATHTEVYKVLCIPGHMNRVNTIRVLIDPYDPCFATYCTWSMPDVHSKNEDVPNKSSLNTADLVCVQSVVRDSHLAVTVQRSNYQAHCHSQC